MGRNLSLSLVPPPPPPPKKKKKKKNYSVTSGLTVFAKSIDPSQIVQAWVKVFFYLSLFCMSKDSSTTWFCGLLDKMDPSLNPYQTTKF